MLVDGCLCEDDLVLFGETDLIKVPVTLAPEFLDKIGQYLDLVLGIDPAIDNAELPKYFQVFLLMEDVNDLSIDHVAR